MKRNNEKAKYNATKVDSSRSGQRAPEAKHPTQIERRQDDGDCISDALLNHPLAVITYSSLPPEATMEYGQEANTSILKTAVASSALSLIHI